MAEAGMVYNNQLDKMQNLKRNIIRGWTFSRILYAGVGLAIMADSIINQQWIGILLGGYFAAMGIFAFGCAAGNCSIKKV